MSFMCNDLYQELLEIIPRNICISSKNVSSKVRKENLQLARKVINSFIHNNPNYKAVLYEYYKTPNIDFVISQILIGLVFYIANTTDRYARLDIFNDKKSICHNEMTLLNFI